MYRRIFIFLFLAIAIAIAIISAIYLNNNKNKTEYINKNIEESIFKFNNSVLYNKDKYRDYYKDRYVIINNTGLSIGETKNELENGYYDIKVEIKEKHIELYVNKLFKEFNENIISDEGYVNELVDYIIKIFDLRIDKKIFSDVIVSNYDIIRDIDRNNVGYVDKIIQINDIELVISSEENMLVLKMGDI